MPIDVPLRSAIALFLIIVSGSAPPAFAQAQTAPTVGSQVVIKGGAALKVGDQVVDTGKSHRVYKVEKVQDDWLWLVSGKVAGWARATDAVSLDQALDLFNAEIKRDPHSASALSDRGLIYQDRGEIDKAHTDYSAALAQDPKYVPALINRGNIWLSKGDYDRAITDYTAAIAVEPTDAAAHQNRGIAYQFKRDFDKALVDYDEAIRLDMKTPSVHNNRGHAREMKHDYEGAIADYSEVIQLDPLYALAWANRGSARKAKGDYEGALADDAEAIRLTPKSPRGYSQRAWILATCPDAKYRDGKQALELALQACELTDSKDASTLDVRAAAHAETGDFAKAVFWEQRAIASIPKTATADAEVYRARLKLYETRKPYREERPGGVTANR